MFNEIAQAKISRHLFRAMADVPGRFRHPRPLPGLPTPARVLKPSSVITGLAVICACLSGCNNQPKASEQQPTKAAGEERADVPKPEPQAAPGVREDGEIISAVTWFEGTLEQALAKAKTDGKLVFIDVGAYWCPPCHALDEEVFVKPEVGAFLDEKFVSIHIDAEKGEGPDIVDRYHIQAYPTLLVLEASGVEKGRLVDSMEPAALIAALGKLAGGQNVLAELEAAVAAAPDDLKARYELAHAHALAARQQDALTNLAAVIEGDPDNAQGLAAAAMYDRAMFLTAKLDGDRERAVAEFRELQKKFPTSKQSIRAYRQIGRQLCKLGRPDEAVQSLEQMIATDPKNPDLKGSYGWFSFRQKCSPEAGLRAVEAGLEQDPKSANLHYLRAELRHQLGDSAEALVSIRNAAKLEPKSAYFKRQVRRFEQLASG